ncbi:MAG: hypothetical protein EAZ55_09865 [Cytophagales bacterium]|nr:MAG: hypothetical protein EAZ55_09865 [Cytophagales bacterium]
MIQSLFANTLLLISRDKFFLIFMGTVFFLNTALIVILAVEGKFFYETSSTPLSRWLSYVTLLKLVSLFVINFPLFFLVYRLEAIEQNEQGKRRFVFLPLTFSQLYLIRLLIVVLMLSVFYFLLGILCFLVLLFKFADTLIYINHFLYLLYYLLVSHLGYLALITLFSFLIKTYFGIIQLFIFVLFVPSKYVFVPSSYAYSFTMAYTSYYSPNPPFIIEELERLKYWYFLQYPFYSLLFLLLTLLFVFIFEKKIQNFYLHRA